MSSIATIPAQRESASKRKDNSHKEARRRKRERPGNEDEALQEELEVLIELASCGGLDHIDQYQDSL